MMPAFRIVVVVSALTLLLSWGALRVQPYPLVGTDDANIHFVYAKNLLDGHGFAYNPGGERVEGTSSLVYVLLCALAFLFFPRPEQALFALDSLTLGIGFGGLVAFVALAIGREIEPERRRNLVVPVLVVLLALWFLSFPPLWFWGTVSLMETPLWLALNVLTAVAALTAPPGVKGTALLVVPALLLLAARPEGVLLGPVYAVVFAIVAWFRDREMRLGPPVAVATGLGALLLGRMAYFGYPLPNTYYAKMSPDVLYNVREGFAHLTGFLREMPGSTVLIASSLAGVAVLWKMLREPARRSDPLQLFLVGASFLVWLHLAIPVWEGGDQFPGFRLLLPAHLFLPLPALAGLALLARRQGSGARSWGITAVVVVVGTTLAVDAAVRWRNYLSRPFTGELQVAAGYRLMGSDFNDLFPESARPSLGVVSAGGINVTYEGPVHDLLGLNSIAMGHSPGDRRGLKGHSAFDADVFWDMSPDLVAPLDYREAHMVRQLLYLDFFLKGLLRDDRFREHYLPVVFRDRTRPETWPKVFTFVRRGYLPRLLENARVELRRVTLEFDGTGST